MEAHKIYTKVQKEELNIKKIKQIIIKIVLIEIFSLTCI